MFFAILWKNRELSLKELELLEPKNIKYMQNQHLICFDTDNESLFSRLAWIIKWWKVIEWDLGEIFSEKGKVILWVADKNQGINLKKKYALKRFKQVDIFHTDLEIKSKWVELVKIWNSWWEVMWYQNIKLYEVVDFQKPWRSMQMGMMPAKLTHTLINIGLSYEKEDDKVLIYDPFLWSGTTCFLANYFWYDTIGSDIKLTFADKNFPRWSASEYNKQGLIFEKFLHDATKEFEDKTIFWWRTPLIITEGWLGPIIKQSTTPEQVKEYQRWVKNVYLPWIEMMGKTFEEKPVMVFTIPRYLGYENLLEKQIIEKAAEVGFRFESLQEMYKRDQHKVARKVVILR